MVEVLEDALNDISADGVEQTDTLRELISQDRLEHHRFVNSELPPRSGRWNLTIPESDEIRQIWFKKRNVCHMAMLPSEIRFKGILTETDPINMFDLPDGLLSSSVRHTPNEGEHMRLISDAATRQTCEVPLNMDHQDYFYVGEPEGWKELTLPNEAEIREYRTGDEPFKGLIMTCFVLCPWYVQCAGLYPLSYKSQFAHSIGGPNKHMHHFLSLFSLHSGATVPKAISLVLASKRRRWK